MTPRRAPRTIPGREAMGTVVTPGGAVEEGPDEPEEREAPATLGGYAWAWIETSAGPRKVLVDAFVPDTSDPGPEPERVPTGPFIEVTDAHRPLRGRPCVICRHGTYAQPSRIGVEVVVVRASPETQDPAAWRGKLPGVAFSLDLHPDGIDDEKGAGYRNRRSLGAWGPKDNPVSTRQVVSEETICVEVLGVACRATRTERTRQDGQRVWVLSGAAETAIRAAAKGER